MGGEVGLDPKDTVKRVHHRDTENSFLSSLYLLGGRKRKLGVFAVQGFTPEGRSQSGRYHGLATISDGAPKERHVISLE